jgi:hypothetical protein
MYKISTREQATQLRKEGYSFHYISEMIGVPKSTLSNWLNQIPYIANSQTIESLGKAQAAAGERKNKILQESFEEIRKEAQNEIGNLTQRDLFIYGLGLYLGEGAKTNNGVCISNADPKVVKLATAWFLSLGVSSTQFSPRIHIYPDNDLQECLQFWANTISIPISQFQKSHIDQRTDKIVKKKNLLPYGTLHLSVRSRGQKEFGVRFFRKIQIWNEVLLENITKRD